MQRVLIVEDEPHLAEGLRFNLEAEGFEAEVVESGERALERLKPVEREAVIGRVEMGYSYEELAEVLGKPSADAARKAAQRALVRLVEEMDGDVG